MALPVNTMTGMEAMGIAANVGTQASVRSMNAATTANKYADLRLKTQEIAQRDLEIEELEAQQEGKLTGAEILNQRNANMLENIEGVNKTDSLKISLDHQNTYMQLQDQQRQAVASMSKSVIDEESHTRAYEELNSIAQDLDSTAEEMFKIDREWKGKDTIDDWKFNENTALASQQFMQSERTAAVKYKRTQERDDFLKESNIERDFSSFQYDVILQNMNNQAALELNSLKGKKGVDIKRSDIESMSPSEVAATVGIFLSGISDLDMDDEETLETANETAIKVSKEVDKSWIEFKENKRPRPLTQGEAIQKVMGELQGRIGTDGDLYNIGDSKLNKQKNEWGVRWITSGSNPDLATSPEDREVREKFAILPKEAKEAFAERAWFDPEARKERD